MNDVLYSIDALATGGGRNGHVTTADGALDLEMAAPTAMGGSGEGLNPEQLFAAGYATCFHSALLACARMAKVAVEGTSVGARVDLVRTAETQIRLAVTLEVVVPSIEHDQAVELAAAAHQMCPYSQAVRGNVDVTITVSDD